MISGNDAGAGFEGMQCGFPIAPSHPRWEAGQRQVYYITTYFSLYALRLEIHVYGQRIENGLVGFKR
jgi:hypothetical protein